MEAVLTTIAGVLASPGLAPLGDERLRFLTLLTPLTLPDVTFFPPDGVGRSTFLAVATAVADCAANCPEIYSPAQVLEVGELLCHPPGAAMEPGPSACSFSFLVGQAAALTSCPAALAAAALALLRLPVDARQATLRIAYKYGACGLLEPGHAIASAVPPWRLTVAVVERLDLRLQAASPLPEDAEARRDAVQAHARLAGNPTMAGPASPPGQDSSAAARRPSFVVPPLAPAIVCVEEAVTVDADGLFRAHDGGPRVRPLSTIAYIDGVMGSVRVGLDARDGTLCCLKGLVYGCPLAADVSPSPEARQARRDACVAALRHETSMAMICGSPLAASSLFTTPVDAWVKMPLMFGSLQALEGVDFDGGDRALALLFGMRGVLRQITAMHARGVVHRDIKPGNILHRGTSSLHLSDFEMAAHCDQLRTSFGGTPDYQAPEQRRHRALGPHPWRLGSLRPADVFGVALSFAALLRNDLFARAEVDSFWRRQRFLAALQMPRSGCGVEPARFRAAVRGLIGDMLSPWPILRPTAERAGARLDAILAGAERGPADHYWALLAGWELSALSPPLRDAGLAELPADARDPQRLTVRWRG